MNKLPILSFKIKRARVFISWWEFAQWKIQYDKRGIIICLGKYDFGLLIF